MKGEVLEHLKILGQKTGTSEDQRSDAEEDTTQIGMEYHQKRA